MLSRRSFSRPALLAAITLALFATSCGKVTSLVDQIQDKIRDSIRKTPEIEPIIKAPAEGEEGYLFGGMLHSVGASAYRGLVNDPNRLVFVYFSASWCPPCKILEPQMGKLAAEFPETTLFVKVDVDQNPALAHELGVKSIPDVRYFRSGKMLGNFIGLLPIEEVREIVKQNAPTSVPPKPRPEASVAGDKPAPANPPPAKSTAKPGVKMVVIPSTPTPAKEPEKSFLDKLKEKAGLVKKPDPAVEQPSAPPPIRPAKPDEEWLPAGMGRGPVPPPPPPPPAVGQQKK